MAETRLHQLRDIEAILELKARYFRLVDTKDWDGFRALFTDDATFEVVGTGYVVEGADAFLEVARGALDDARSAHHGHTPEVTLDGPAEAHATWVMSDYVEWPARDGERRGFTGYGRYEERYRKAGGTWRIAGWRLTYQRADPHYPEPLPEGILA